MKPERKHEHAALPEGDESLWRLAAGPGIWLVHFLLSYVAAAIVCAKFPAMLPSVRVAIALLAVLAMTAIALVGWHGHRRHRSGDASRPHDGDTAEDRHRFLGFATLLLCGVSLVAVAYTVLVPLFIGDCR